MSASFQNRIALVTGAAQGIGQAIALALKAAGASVHLLDRDEANVTQFGDIHALPDHVLDLSDRAAVHASVGHILEQTDRIDILVNGAGGVRGQVGKPIAEVTGEDWRVLFQANVDSAFWMTQAVAPLMQRQGFGRIINIASGAGLRPSLTGVQAYTAAKHALVGLTKQVSQDLGRFGVTCNAVAPGFVLSNPATRRQWEAYSRDGQAKLVESIHTRRLGSPEDIANAVLFLAGEQSGWVSGQILSVDGGRS